MTRNPLRIVLTFDAESDVFDPSFNQSGDHTQSWRGIDDGIPIIDGILGQLRDSFGGRACSTWFVRCDDQLQNITGEHAYLLRHFRDCWLQHEDAGDEIGFHPHLYKQTDTGWKQETDESALKSQVFRAYAAMREAGFKGRVSRIGEAFSSNAVMNSLDELGIMCDSTAMPGRVRRDSTRHIDWGGTPDLPYHPGRADYRLPGADSCALVEIPMSLVSTMASYDREPLRRYVDLSFHHHILIDGLSAILPTVSTLVTVTHPSTILSGIAAAPHGLLSFSAAEFARNLQFILSECNRIGRAHQFVKLSECVNNITS